MTDTSGEAPAKATVSKKGRTVRAPVPMAAAVTKKVPAPKKPRLAATLGSHPTTAVMVNEAVRRLNEKGGSSLYAIKKYIQGTYVTADVDRLRPFIRKYLKKAVGEGTLLQIKGKGASGSFKMPPVLKEKSVKAPKKPTATKKVKPAATKTTKAKATVVKKTPAAAVPVKKAVEVTKKPAEVVRVLPKVARKERAPKKTASAAPAKDEPKKTAEVVDPKPVGKKAAVAKVKLPPTKPKASERVKAKAPPKK